MTAVLRYEEMNWTDVVTPVNVNQLARLLEESLYPKQLTDKLVKQFKQGFDLGYRGPLDRQDKSDNIPLRIGDATE